MGARALKRTPPKRIVVRLLKGGHGGFSRAESEAFEAMLLEHKRTLLADVTALEKDRTVEEGSTLPLHLAERATDSSAQDLSLNRMESATAEIREIDEALERIRDGSFGRCEECDEELSPARLEAIPYARLCIRCKTRDEGSL